MSPGGAAARHMPGTGSAHALHDASSADGREGAFVRIACRLSCARGRVGAGALSRLPAPVTPPAPPPWETLFNCSSPSAATAAASVVHRQVWPSAVPVCIWKLRPVAHVGLSLSNTWQLAALLLLYYSLME